MFKLRRARRRASELSVIDLPDLAEVPKVPDLPDLPDLPDDSRMFGIDARVCSACNCAVPLCDRCWAERERTVAERLAELDTSDTGDSR